MAIEVRKYLGEVTDVRPDLALDMARLGQFLGDSVPGFAGPLSLRMFQGGFSNPTYLLETPGRRYVLRKQPPGKLLKSAHAVDREYRIMRTLFAQDFPVPEPLAFCDDAALIGTKFYVMAHVAGKVFQDSALPDLAPGARAALYDNANAVLARLHRFDYTALGLADYGRPGNYFARQIARWTQQYEASRSAAIPEMEWLADWLAANVPADERTSIVHGDYSFHNLLVDPAGPRIVAVLDWELSTLGHPFGDLMYHAMEWYRPFGVSARGTLAGRDLAALGIPTLDNYIARYCERAGMAAPAELNFYKAYNLFRLAAIAQGIAGRVRDGSAVSPEARAQAERVRPMAAAAWAFARAGGAG